MRAADEGAKLRIGMQGVKTSMTETGEQVLRKSKAMEASKKVPIAAILVCAAGSASTDISAKFPNAGIPDHTIPTSTSLMAALFLKIRRRSLCQAPIQSIGLNNHQDQTISIGEL